MLFGLSSSFGLILIMKIEFKCQNAIFMPNSNVKIEFFFVKIQYSSSVRKSKLEFEW